jgi:hypothetical protein
MTRALVRPMASIPGRLLALGAAAFFLAFPVRAFLMAAEAPLAARLLWVVLLIVGVWPASRARILIACVPFLPWLPFAVKSMPGGIVHLLVLSQAIPWLVHRALGRGRAPAAATATETTPGDLIGRLWILFLLTAICGALPFYAALARGSEGSWPFFADLSTQLERYVLLKPSLEFANLIAACSAFADAVLAWLIVRTSTDSTLSLVRLSAITVTGAAAAGVWQAFTGLGLRPDWRLNDPHIIRINGAFSDPNALAAYLGIMTPLLIAFAGRAAGRLRSAWLAATGLVLLALVLTAGRVGLIAALAGVATVALGALRHGLDREDAVAFVRLYFRRAVIAAFALAIVGAGVLAAAGTALDARHHAQQSHVDTWLYTFNLRRPLDETFKGRLGIWRTAAHIVRDHPMFGIGPGRIFRVFPAYSEDVPEAPQGLSMSAHDTFLNVAAELGATGLVVWLALLAAIVHAAWRGAGLRSDVEREGGPWIGVGLLGAWCACLVTMTTGDRTILREDLVILGVLSAFVARRAIGAPPSRTIRGVLVAATVLLLAVTPFRMRAASDEVRLDRVTSGLHAIERGRDGTPFRWTSGHAVFHVPPSTATLTLKLRTIAPFRQTIRVLVRNAQVAEITPEDGNWRSTRIMLPRPRGAEYHRIEVLVSPTWRPRNENRELGVMLAWERAPNP